MNKISQTGRQISLQRQDHSKIVMNLANSLLDDEQTEFQ